MTIEEINSFAERLNKTVKTIEDWDVEDQYMYVSMVGAFFETLKPIVDKYGLSKPKKFIVKWLDEL